MGQEMCGLEGRAGKDNDNSDLALARNESLQDQEAEQLRLAKAESLKDLSPEDRAAREQESASQREARAKAAEARLGKLGGSRKKAAPAKKSGGKGVHLTKGDFY